MEIIAHRGASGDAPENTLASFLLGWQQNADANELDVHLTNDNQVVVIHDDNTRRTTGVDKKVEVQTLDELQRLDAGSFQGPEWTGERLPALTEVAANIPSGRRLFIEIKCGTEVLPALEKVVAASGKTAAQFVIIGFSLETMRQAKMRLPALSALWLSSLEEGKEGGKRPTIEELITQAKEAGMDGLDLEAGEAVDAACVAKVHQAGMSLYVWTVDDDALARQLARAGVDGITTNRPGWMRERLAEVPVAAL